MLWKDSLVLSIGQDARGPGGQVELVSCCEGRLVPIFGPEEPTSSAGATSGP